MRPLRNDPPAPSSEIASREAAQVELLGWLKASGYRFVAPTPETHRRVLLRRPGALGRDLRDVLGWTLPFGPGTLPAPLVDRLDGAGLLTPAKQGFRACVRVSSLDDELFLHSAFPTSAADSVFFGPDTYRFANFLQQELDGQARVGLLVDIGTGSGAGAVVASKAGRAERMILTDINPGALQMARVNLAAAGVVAEYRLASGLEGVTEPADLIIANPPYIAGDGQTYRAGGDMHGARLSLEWALQGAARLSPGGRFLLYTGSAIVDGFDGLHAALQVGLDPTRHSLAYRELDPDVFGNQLDAEGYESVERIAAVGAVITRS